MLDDACLITLHGIASASGACVSGRGAPQSTPPPSFSYQVASLECELQQQQELVPEQPEKAQGVVVMPSLFRPIHESEDEDECEDESDEGAATERGALGSADRKLVNASNDKTAVNRPVCLPHARRRLDAREVIAAAAAIAGSAARSKDRTVAVAAAEQRVAAVMLEVEGGEGAAPGTRSGGGEGGGGAKPACLGADRDQRDAGTAADNASVDQLQSELDMAREQLAWDRERDKEHEACAERMQCELDDAEEQLVRSQRQTDELTRDLHNATEEQRLALNAGSDEAAVNRPVCLPHARRRLDAREVIAAAAAIAGSAARSKDRTVAVAAAEQRVAAVMLEVEGGEGAAPGTRSGGGEGGGGAKPACLGADRDQRDAGTAADNASVDQLQSELDMAREQLAWDRERDKEHEACVERVQCELDEMQEQLVRSQRQTDELTRDLHHAVEEQRSVGEAAAAGWAEAERLGAQVRPCLNRNRDRDRYRSCRGKNCASG